jgi:hypothetical protein
MEQTTLNSFLNINKPDLLIEIFIVDGIRVYRDQIKNLDKFLKNKKILKQILDHKITSLSYDFVDLNEELKLDLEPLPTTLVTIHVDFQWVN